jgi:hypothetical protein
MVDLAVLQSVSYIAGALGVCVAATYYVMAIRNNEKTRKNSLVYQRLQALHQFYDSYFAVLLMTDWNTMEEFLKKYGPRTNFNAHIKYRYVVNHYNTLGIMMKDGLVTADEIFQLYMPYGIIGIYEKFKPMLMRDRITPSGEVHNPDANKGYELLYTEAKRRYPKSPPFASSEEEQWEHTRRIQEYLAKNPNP